MIPNTYHIETYGCQMNFSDSEIVASVLNKANYVQVSKAEEASLIFLNTCSIREHAEQRVLNRLKHLKSLKNKNNRLIIGILGCMAERIQDKLFEEGADLIAGPDTYRELPQMIQEVINHSKAVNTLLSESETYEDINPLRIGNNEVSAFISIMRGCQNFCSYCVVPYTRGSERSRSPESILVEAKELFENGYREVILLGQNVNSYRSGVYGFPKLISKVAEINPLLRIRFATSHPKDLSNDLIEVIAEYPNICKSIHLPLQSGSNRILQLMNRKYTSEFYLDRINAIYKAIPECSISSDIIAGFCSETEEDHQQTIAVMKQAAFDYAFMFKYSERSGTTASEKMNDDVPEKTKLRRLNEIINLQNQLSLHSNKKDIGKISEVLVESTSKRSSKQLSGRTSQNKVVVFTDDKHKAGDYVNVRITQCSSATLQGDVAPY